MVSVFAAHAQLSSPRRCWPDFTRGCSVCTMCHSQSTYSRYPIACASNEWQRSAFGGKVCCGLRQAGEIVNQCFRVDESEFISGLCGQWKRNRVLIRIPESRTFRSMCNCHGKHVKRSEICEAIEERRVMSFKSVNIPQHKLCSLVRQSCFNVHVKRGSRWPRSSAVSSIVPAVLAGEETAKIKVIGSGVGSSAILNFCQQSSLLPSAQFWYCPDSTSEPILLPDSLRGSHSTATEFCNRGDGEGTQGHSIPCQEVEGKQYPLTAQDSNGDIVFMVLGAGSGPGFEVVPGQLRAVRSKGSVVVGIFIQPFMFEGIKRLEQATQLINGLLECTDLLLVVEQDGLLRRDVTVAEASSMAKNAVLLSIKALSELLMGRVDSSIDTTIENLITDDTKKIVQHAGKSWLGCGKGQNYKDAIEMALAEAPTADFLSFASNRLVICTLASALGLSREDVLASESVVHEALGPDVRPIIRSFKNPMLESGVKLSTIIISRSSQEQALSTVSEAVTPVGIDNDPPVKQESNVIGAPDLTPGNGLSSIPRKPIQQEQIRSVDKDLSIHYNRMTSRDDFKPVDGGQSSAQASLASSATQKSRLALGWESGPSSDVAEAWARARAQAREPTLATPELEASSPIGVRSNGQQNTNSPSATIAFSSGYDEVAEDKWIGKAAVPVDPDARPRNQMVDMGLEAVREMYNAASALVMGKESSTEKRQASLSQRASSMLESERSHKKLTPLVEMGFKNGKYEGRCQGGLPEGKGRLSFSDGSFYFGQWKQGKRTGPGAFYYTNGDMFQGSWKDDVMHGKGWMYYHNGDRLYANFWKGKADGEGRFYSALGDVFFGQFRENWRHGEFLYIEASGIRWIERWDSGILKSRTPGDT